MKQVLKDLKTVGLFMSAIVEDSEGETNPPVITLDYNTNWNSIIPVVGFIKTILNNPKSDISDEDTDRWDESLDTALRELSCEGLLKTCAEFIEWYKFERNPVIEMLEKVRKIHPQVVMVIINKEHQWCFVDEDFNTPDVPFIVGLDRMVDYVVNTLELPYVYQK